MVTSLIIPCVVLLVLYSYILLHSPRAGIWCIRSETLLQESSIKRYLNNWNVMIPMNQLVLLNFALLNDVEKKGRLLKYFLFTMDSKGASVIFTVTRSNQPHKSTLVCPKTQIYIDIKCFPQSGSIIVKRCQIHRQHRALPFVRHWRGVWTINTNVFKETHRHHIYSSMSFFIDLFMMPQILSRESLKGNFNKDVLKGACSICLSPQGRRVA